MPRTHTKTLSTQIPLPLADRVDALAARLRSGTPAVVCRIQKDHLVFDHKDQPAAPGKPVAAN